MICIWMDFDELNITKVLNTIFFHPTTVQKASEKLYIVKGFDSESLLHY